jgi:hypothetical protein
VYSVPGGLTGTSLTSSEENQLVSSAAFKIKRPVMNGDGETS